MESFEFLGPTISGALRVRLPTPPEKWHAGDPFFPTQRSRRDVSPACPPGPSLRAPSPPPSPRASARPRGLGGVLDRARRAAQRVGGGQPPLIRVLHASGTRKWTPKIAADTARPAPCGASEPAVCSEICSGLRTKLIGGGKREIMSQQSDKELKTSREAIAPGGRPRPKGLHRTLDSLEEEVDHQWVLEERSPCMVITLGGRPRQRALSRAQDSMGEEVDFQSDEERNPFNPGDRPRQRGLRWALDSLDEEVDFQSEEERNRFTPGPRQRGLHRALDSMGEEKECDSSSWPWSQNGESEDFVCQTELQRRSSNRILPPDMSDGSIGPDGDRCPSRSRSKGKGRGRRGYLVRYPTECPP